MRFGFHISISGGLRNVAERAKELNCDCAQIFSRNPRGWKYTLLDKDDVKEFKQSTSVAKISPVVIHMPYLPNLASPDKQLYKQSVDSLTEELRRTKILGIKYVVTHVGKAMREPIPNALKRVTEALNQALNEVKNKSIVLLENTAGQGSEIGYKFEHIAEIMESVSSKERVGVCFDTCHAYAAGYDIATEKGLEKTVSEINTLIDSEKIKIVHLNDAKKELGSHVDRHWQIGKGFIGEEGFRLIINHPAFKNLHGIMETPRTDIKEAIQNMKIIRSLSDS
ncbi:MAG: deoxyribonuclease IV [Planctomycetota bacterium]